MRRHTFGYDILFFLAILASLLALSPDVAHLFEMPRKLTLSRDAYFTVQKIYAGWELFGAATLAQFLTLVLLARASFREYYVFRPVLASLVLMLMAQALFWLFAFPADAATAGWGRVTPDWDDLRHIWEYAHAGSALCQIAALCLLISALFARVRAAGR